MVRVSVIIPTYNSEESIGQTLDSIKQQDFTDFEVVIVDGKSTDNTLKIAKEYKGTIQIISKKSNIPQARNIGIESAKAEIILLVDSDETIPSDFITKCLDVLTNREIIGIKINVSPVPKQNKVFEYFYIMRDLAYKKLKNKNKRYMGEKASWYHLRCFRKILFYKINGFNNTMGFFEDEDFSERAQIYCNNTIYKIHKTKDLMITHYHYFVKSKNFKEYYKNIFKSGRLGFAFLSKYPRKNSFQILQEVFSATFLISGVILFLNTFNLISFWSVLLLFSLSCIGIGIFYYIYLVFRLLRSYRNFFILIVPIIYYIELLLRFLGHFTALISNVATRSSKQKENTSQNGKS